MSIRAAVYDLLNDVTSQVHALAAPQELTSPYAVWSIRDEPIRVQGAIQIHNVFLTVNIYANTRDATITLASSIYTGLEGKTGSYSDQTLMICNWMGENEDYIPDLDKWTIGLDFELKFQ
jgi:hypothetical protein